MGQTASHQLMNNTWSLQVPTHLPYTGHRSCQSQYPVSTMATNNYSSCQSYQCTSSLIMKSQPCQCYPVWRLRSGIRLSMTDQCDHAPNPWSVSNLTRKWFERILCRDKSVTFNIQMIHDDWLSGWGQTLSVSHAMEISLNIGLMPAYHHFHT